LKPVLGVAILWMIDRPELAVSVRSILVKAACGTIVLPLRHYHRPQLGDGCQHAVESDQFRPLSSVKAAHRACTMTRQASRRAIPIASVVIGRPRRGAALPGRPAQCLLP